jgi:hypothetical protein
VTIRVGDRVRFVNDIPNTWFEVLAKRTSGDGRETLRLDGESPSFVGTWWYAEFVAEVEPAKPKAVPAWMLEAPGEPCPMWHQPVYAVDAAPEPRFPTNEPVIAIRAPLSDGGVVELAATASGWTYGGEDEPVALCPEHASLGSRVALHFVLGEHDEVPS